MSGQTLLYGNSLMDEMIADAVGFLVQTGARLGSIVDDRHVITIT